MRKKVDFLIIGSGIAGLTYALKVAEYGTVCVISKVSLNETNTRYAQGGIAAVLYQPDSFEKHVNDTLIAGDELCNLDTVKFIIKESTHIVNELIKWGANFDKTDSGKYDLGKEGGHSENRIIHHKDNTGSEIMRALIERVRQNNNIELLENNFAVDIITEHHLGMEIKKISLNKTCFGAYVLDQSNNQIKTILAKKTLISTGGIGMVYSNTTNPTIATGDGISIAYRAKAQVENMEFVQFHPTALYNPKEKPAFLITEALRGHGAILKDYYANEFMSKYDDRGSLSPRDIVARAIDNEMKTSGKDHVYLDARDIHKDDLLKRFPNIYNKCLEIGIDITKDMIPVVPAAHYLCGGIKVDKYGKTTIKNLYASGECASTGMHGANRLASNSLLEALVISDMAAKNAIETLRYSDFRDDVPDWNDEGTVLHEEMILITQSLKELQSIMSNYVGIVRSDLRLKRALDRLELLYKETEDIYQRSKLFPKLCELRNAINIGYLIIEMAMARKESRGLHYSIDYPFKLVKLTNTLK